MATSLLTMSSDQTPTDHHEEQTMKGLAKAEEGSSSRNNRVRRKGPNNPNQKKQRLRGMGVAQLESLRVQETLKNIHHSSPLLPSLLHHPLIPHPHGHGHGPHLHCPPNRWMVTNQVDPYGFGAPIWTPLLGTPLETSKELSSMPNHIPHSQSHYCDVCLKKKRFNEDNNAVNGCNTSRSSSDKALDMWPMMMNGPDFLGFTPQQSPNYLAAETLTTDYFTTRHTHTAAAYSPRNPNEFVEVVAVHRKGNSSSGRVFMEYEFFPGKNDTDEAAANTRGYNINIGYSDTSVSNSVDLSLKL